MRPQTLPKHGHVFTGTRWAAVPEVRLVAGGLLANLAWELAASPLYADAGRGVAHLLRTRLHCTLGDLLILLGAWAGTTLLVRGRHWLAQPTLKSTSTFVALGLAYTAWSEYFNVHVVGEWGYGPRMPLVFGIGLAPLLQWILLPTLLARWSAPPAAEAESVTRPT